jgi:hypothetical protein
MWQTVERKQRFIAQLRTGGQVSRTVEDIGDSDAISYAEFKAASSGNPLILEREQLVAEVSRLATLERAHHDEQRRLQFEARQAEAAAASAASDIAALEAALRVRQPTEGDRFAMAMNGRRFTTRGDAGPALLHHVAEAHQGTRLGRDSNAVIGALGGFDLRLEATRHADDVILSLDGIPTATTHIDVKDLGGDNAGYNVIRRLEGHLNRIETVLDQRRNSEREHRTLAEQTSHLLGTPFERTDELAAAKQRLATVEKGLAELDRPLSRSAEDRSESNPRQSVPVRPRSQGRMPAAQVGARPRDATRPPAPHNHEREL